MTVDLSHYHVYRSVHGSSIVFTTNQLTIQTYDHSFLLRRKPQKVYEKHGGVAFYFVIKYTCEKTDTLQSTWR